MFFLFLMSCLLLKVSRLNILKSRPILLYIVVCRFLFPLVESECPTTCSCTTNSVICVNGDMEEIPNFEIINVDPITIDLSGNPITIIGIDDFYFKKSFMVKELYLNDTHLIDIDSKAFSTMENLQELYLGNNLLNSVPFNFIEFLCNMVLLDLSGNYFEGDIPTIRSKSLEALILINCQISDTSVEVLKYLPNLRLLSLEQNNLHSINIDTFKSISNNGLLLRLPYNTWYCSCQIIQVFMYMAQNKYIDSSEPYECQVNNKAVNIFKSTEQICGSIIRKSKTQNQENIINKEDNMFKKKLINVNLTDEKIPKFLKTSIEIKSLISSTELNKINNIPFNPADRSNQLNVFIYIVLFLLVGIVVVCSWLYVEYKKNTICDNTTAKLIL